MLSAFSATVHMIGSKQERAGPSEAVPARPTSGTRMREARFEDYKQIASLQSRFDLGVKPYEEWAHLWQGNPLYRELHADWPIGWVLEDGDGEIVGSMGNIPLLYERDGRRILAATGHHWVAELAHRGESLLLLDNLIKQRYLDLYVNTTVSDAAVPAVTALGCSRVPVGVWDEVGYWITNYLGCLKSVITAKSDFLLPSWEGSWTHLKALGGQLFRLPRRLFLPAAMKIRGSGKAALGADVPVTECAGFDDRFDGFWEDLKRNDPHLLLAVRSREYLQWHFKYALLGKRLWIATVVDGARIHAYAIFLKTMNARAGVKQVKLVDYQSLDGGTAMLEPLLRWALRKCRSEGVHILEHTGRWMDEGEFFDRVAPYRRKLPAWQYFYRVNDPALKEPLADKRAWAPSLFDGDVTL